MNKIIVLFAVGWIWSNSTWAQSPSNGLPTHLTCEFRENPRGIDAVRPRLSWAVPAGRQTAYQVLAASTPQRLDANQGDLWDSGKRVSDQNDQIDYDGIALGSSAACHWKVRVWDQNNTVSSWSQPASWSMGILNPTDWTAKWISTERMPQTGGVLIISNANYRALDGAGSNNVTTNVSRLITNGAMNFAVSPTILGGDPSPGHKKELVVEYTVNGVGGTASAVDFSRLIAPEPAATYPEPLEAPYVRKVFTLAAAPSSAVATIHVLGFYELVVNGVKVGPNVMGPALPNYNKRSLYETYDLAPYLQQGTNCIGLWLSRGWYWLGRIPAIKRETAIARVQLDLTVAGNPMRIVTDNSWRCRTSGRSILGEWKWNNFGGEQVDSRQDVAQWADPALNDSDWFPVLETSGPTVPSVAQKCPPMRVLTNIPAVSCTDLGAGAYRMDFGKQVTGWMKLRLHGLNAGQTVVMQYADDLDPLRTYNQIDRFISSGKPEEEFCSKFNYHGFRWVLIEGLAQAPQPIDAEAYLIASDFKISGGFECSNELINRMHEVNLWTLLCLSQSGFLSDCPHRERLGYGDGQVSIESCIMNFEMQPFYDKWATDWVDGAAASGYLPHTAPQGTGGGGPGWGGAAQALTWRNYLYYGDKRIVETNLNACLRHIQAIETHATNDIVRVWGGKWDFIGDWVAPGRGMDTTNWPPVPAAELFNNCYRLYLREQWAKMADIVGKHAEAAACRAELERLRPLIHAAFYDPDKQLYVLDEQSYYLMPLMTGVVPENLRPTILKKLENCIRVTCKGHLDTGMFGTYFLINYLMEIGRNDLLWMIVTKTDYPGWGYMLEQGATTWWEQWNAYYSQIHSCFTSLDGWFSQGLAGIRPDPTAPGFKKILIKPAVVGDLAWVKCHYDSLHGRIISNWERKGNTLTMNVTIPANTTATVYVPTINAESVTESGNIATQSNGVTFLRMENGAAVYAVDSGTYQFKVRN